MINQVSQINIEDKKNSTLPKKEERKAEWNARSLLVITGVVLGGMVALYH